MVNGDRTATAGSAPPTVLSRARLRDHLDLVDIWVSGGRIVSLEPSSGTPPQGAGVTDLAGALVLPPLVESHLHLEKAFLLDRLPRDAVSLADAIAMTAELKATFTPADMRARALRVVRAALDHGVTHVRAHVEVDDVLGSSAIETILALREDLHGVVDIQVVAFPQDGLTSQRHAVELLDRAVTLGVDAVGGIPYADDDPQEHLDLVFALAERSGLPVDLHLDLSDDPGQLDVLAVAERTLAHGMHGQVTVGHLTSLGSVDRRTAVEVAELLAQARISVVTLPATDAYLNGRGDETAPRRGLTPVRLLLDSGVNVAVATNNIQNAFTPFGRGSLLDTALLLATLCHFGSAAEAAEVVDMMTSRAALAIGLHDYGIGVGAPADLTVWRTASPRGLLGEVERPELVLRAGRVITSEEIGA